MALVLVIGLVGAGITAYFNDTEQSTSNTFTAGTVDIEVDDENPWTSSYQVTLGDDDVYLKPCETGIISIDVTNVGNNPVVLWKHIGDVVCTTGNTDFEGFSSEPEKKAAENNGDVDKNNIDKWIIYDLKVGDDIIFIDADGLVINDIQSMWMPIGTLQPGDTVTMEQSYHLKAETGNWAQGDVMTFTIDLYAEQRLGAGPSQLSKKLFLDNKTGDPDWYFVADQTWGILSWDSAGVGGLVAQGLADSTEYSLTTYVEPWPGSPATEIAQGTSDSEGNLEINSIAMPNTYTGKIWLVLTADYNYATKTLTGWNPTEYLFEGNIVSTP
jgi:predicted ribosomally synthesized peptide with SipW-like signal peptide